MSDRAARIRCIGLCTVASFLSLSGGVAHAQGAATLHGVVVDTTGAPVRNADVGIASLKRLTRTDDDGRFTLGRLPVGSVDISIRRLSYEPVVRTYAVAEVNDTVRVVMKVNGLLLDGVYVTAAELRRREHVEDFYRRMTRGLGTYLTRDDIESRASGTPSDLLRTIPGLRLVKTSSGRGVRFPTTSLSRRDCAPMIWIDGQKAPGMEIDEVTLTDIEGIEIDNGPSTTPFQFSQGVGHVACGTIVVWSRPPTPRRR
jgi:hypothetical protein